MDMRYTNKKRDPGVKRGRTYSKGIRTGAFMAGGRREREGEMVGTGITKDIFLISGVLALFVTASIFHFPFFSPKRT